MKERCCMKIPQRRGNPDGRCRLNAKHLLTTDGNFWREIEHLFRVLPGERVVTLCNLHRETSCNWSELRNLTPEELAVREVHEV